jgi:hypothetical protein
MLTLSCSVVFETDGLDIASVLSSNLTEASLEGKFSLNVFPLAQSVDQLRQLLNELSSHSEWRLEEFARDSTASSLVTPEVRVRSTGLVSLPCWRALSQ